MLLTLVYAFSFKYSSTRLWTFHIIWYSFDHFQVMHGIRGMPQVDLLVSHIEDTVELSGACHSAIHRLAIFQVPAPLHLCQGCGY